MSVKQVPKSEKSTTKKPKKKFVGLAAKAKRRKQVSESRLAQRTGISATDRKLRELLKKLTIETGKYEFPKKRPKIDWEKLFPKLKEFKLPKKVKPLEKKELERQRHREKYLKLLEGGSGGRTISVEDMKKGGKAKKMRTYSKGGKAK